MPPDAPLPNATWRPVTRYDVGGANHQAMTPRRLTLHTAVTAGSSLFSLFNTPGNPIAHFYVDADGNAEQYVDTSFRSSAVLDGNHDTIAVESWDNYPHGWKNDGDVPDWTDAQVEWIAELAVWVNKNHGIPLVQLPSSRPGNHRDRLAPPRHRRQLPRRDPRRRATGGEKWSPQRRQAVPRRPQDPRHRPHHHPPRQPAPDRRRAHDPRRPRQDR